MYPTYKPSNSSTRVKHVPIYTTNPQDYISMETITSLMNISAKWKVVNKASIATEEKDVMVKVVVNLINQRNL